MARKANKTANIENLEPQTAVAVAETTQQVEPTPEVAPEASAEETPQAAPKLIVAKRTVNNRWFVYFKGVKPEDNPSCSCKSASSAIRYMYLLKVRHGATISQESFEMLKAEQANERAQAETSAKAEPVGA